MAQVTKLELSQRLEAANVEIAAMRLRISVLEGEVALRAAPRAPAQCAVRRTQWQRPAYMEAAREAAMRLGKVVRIGAVQ